MNLPTILCAAALGALGIAPTAQAQLRAFTNDNGSIIQAELVSHQGGKVTLRRADGKEFAVDPSIFSREDEDHIKAWIAKTPAVQNYNFRVVAEKKKVEGNTRNYGYKRVKNDLWSYLVTLTNNSQEAVSNLKIRYRVFYTNSADGAYSTSSDGLFRMVEGTEKLESELGFNRNFQFTTTPVRIDVVNYDYGNRYKDEIKGCLIQILNQKDDVVFEWCSADVAMKNRTWASTNNTRRGMTSSVDR
jgi:hypothetical protein